MDRTARIDRALGEALTRATASPCPARLAEAIHYAVFPGGGRVRPALCLAVADACGARASELADAAAVAVELLHCASLVQDDLPCFDDAAMRRGRPSLHKRYDEETAILVGDTLIVMAFRAVATQISTNPAGCAEILLVLSEAAGAPSGIAAGQAWESEPWVDIEAYHHAKTAALFEAAAAGGAIAGGADPSAWRLTGGLLGEAYQIADDLADALGETVRLGKPVHKDGDKLRPSVVSKSGTEGARRKLDELLAQATQSIPPCAGRKDVEAFLSLTAERLCPPALRVAR